MGSEPSDTLLDRVRKLLAKAADDAVTPAEAEALTAKATELIARYGIDRALLASARPDTDRPDSRVIDVPNPWARVHAHLLAGLAAALRCQSVLLPVTGGSRVHVFGYTSDLERTEILYTSLLLQMANGLAAAEVPAGAASIRAWRRSWLLGFSTAVIARVRTAEERASRRADEEHAGSGPGTALVLADRAVAIRRECERAYPATKRSRVTFTGRGYGDGYARGERADIGGTGLRDGPPRRARLTGSARRTPSRCG